MSNHGIRSPGYAIVLFWNVFPPSLVLATFVKVAIWHFVFPPSLVVTTFVKVAIWHFLFPLSLVVATFVKVSWKLRYYIFNELPDYMIKGHVTGRLATNSSSLPTLVQISFFKLLHDNIENWYYKVRQLLQNEKENYYKVMTECDRSLLRSASNITKCDCC